MSFAVGLMKSLAKGIDERSARRKKIIDEQMLLAKTKGMQARTKMKATAQGYKNMIAQIKQNVNGQLSDAYLLSLAAGKGGADLKTVHKMVVNRAASKLNKYTAEDLNSMISLNSYALPTGMNLEQGLEQLAGLQQKREEADPSKPSDTKFGKNLLLAGFQVDPQQNAEAYLKNAHYGGLPVNELIQGIGFTGQGKVKGLDTVTTGKGLSALSGGDTIASVYSNQKYFTTNVATKFSSEVDGFSNQGGYFSAIMSTKDGTLKGDAKIALKSKVEELAFKASDVYTSLSREIGDRQALALVNQALGDSSVSAEEAFSNLKKLSDNNNLPVNFSSDVIVPKEEEQLGFKKGEVGEGDLSEGQVNVKTVTNSKLTISVTKPEIKSQIVEVARELSVDLSTLSVETTNKINDEISKINSDKIPAVKLDLIKMFIQQDGSIPKVSKVDTESASKPKVFKEAPKLTEDEKLTADMQQNIYAGSEQDNAMSNLYLGADSPTLGEINDTIPKLPNVGGSFSGYIKEQIKEGIFGQDEKTGERNAKVLADDSKYVKIRVKGFPSSFRVKREDLDLISSSLIENGTVDLFELSDTSKDYGQGKSRSALKRMFPSVKSTEEEKEDDQSETFPETSKSKIAEAFKRLTTRDDSKGLMSKPEPYFDEPVAKNLFKFPAPSKDKLKQILDKKNVKINVPLKILSEKTLRNIRPNDLQNLGETIVSSGATSKTQIKKQIKEWANENDYKVNNSGLEFFSKAFMNR